MYIILDLVLWDLCILYEEAEEEREKWEFLPCLKRILATQNIWEPQKEKQKQNQ